MIKLNQASVSKEISSIRTNGQGLKQSNGNVNLSKTNLVTFKEYVNMFEDYQSALSNYENIIEQDTTAMDTTVTEIVENDREIAGQINKIIKQDG
ncbi:TIGR04197 family type VII secretion effector [Staphylococcus aureus]|nr:TIGR04197 family type VII secretion effector [Staphylococcus aureus]